MEVRETCLDARQGLVTKRGNGAHVMLPSEWVGHKVTVLLLPEAPPRRVAVVPQAQPHGGSP